MINKFLWTFCSVLVYLTSSGIYCHRSLIVMKYIYKIWLHSICEFCLRMMATVTGCLVFVFLQIIPIPLLCLLDGIKLWRWEQAFMCWLNMTVMCFFMFVFWTMSLYKYISHVSKLLFSNNVFWNSYVKDCNHISTVFLLSQGSLRTPVSWLLQIYFFCQPVAGTKRVFIFQAYLLLLSFCEKVIFIFQSSPCLLLVSCVTSVFSFLSQSLYVIMVHKLLYVGSIFQVWNLTNCRLKINHIGHTGYLNTVTVSPDGSLCASGGKVKILFSGVLLYWNILVSDC